VTAYVFSFWIFGRSLQPPPDRRSQRFTVSGLIEFPGRFGGLLKKDLRDLSRLLDFHIAVTIAGLFSLYLIFTAAPSSSSFWIIIVVLFLPACSAAFNCFGLDTPLGLDRYMLLPLTGRDILLSKNLAFALVNIVLFSIMLPFVFWRFGAGVSALGAVEMVVVGLAYVSWGNWMSIKHPFQMQYYRLSSGGSPVDAVLGIIFGSLPGAVVAYLLHKKKYGALWSILATMMFYFALYYVSLSWSGRRLEKHREALRSAIS
jgi:predicted membrane protein